MLEEVVAQLYPSHTKQVMKAMGHALNGRKIRSLGGADRRTKTVYVVYPDSFIDEDGESGLDTLRTRLGYIKRLGCDCVHVLPFLLSPMIDGGFDLSDHFLVRDEVGGNLALDNLLEAMQEKQMSLFMDMVLNHVSYQHRWFQLAESGDGFYRDFFIWQADKPEFVERFIDEGGVWARYKLGEREITLRVIFPEQVGEVPHWTQGRDGMWYYHTFYPHQLDLNWDNYHVFVAFAKALVYWAKKGVDFRLDAVPFVGKVMAEGRVESTERTHLIVQALSMVTKDVNEDGIFLVEANQPREVMLKYFGTEEQSQADMAYGFELMGAMWHALVTGQVEKIWEVLGSVYGEHNKKWVNFIRNHDELTLEFAPSEIRQKLLEMVGDGGYKVRDGFGVAGRTISLLGGSKKRLLNAYTLLASMPGSLAVYYGDELGVGNNVKHMEEVHQEKIDRSGDTGIAVDYRDVNRGGIGVAELLEKSKKQIYMELSELLQARHRHLEMFEVKPVQVETPEGVFGCKYQTSEGTLTALVNLTDTVKRVAKPSGRMVFEANDTRVGVSEIELPEYAVCWMVDVA